ncbi:MAG: hypothetical protein EA397_03765 [Deltaproteobacteria bacterium]|nr:MAG: hypothetical protein EA397_03765 [Deltaproteobacteria bacterium]
MDNPHEAAARDAIAKAITTVVVLLVSLIAMNALVILIMSDGVFVYGLDDPYIHLALAENLLQGTYGVNPGEHSSPSSSILWPLLLAPFSWSPWAPLIINTVAALALVVVFAKIGVLTLRDERYPIDPLELTFLVAALVVATNLIGLVFVGMEHVVQLLFVSLIAWGLLRILHGSDVPVWLPLVIAMSPGWRFENVVISVAAVLFLFFLGKTRAALAGLGGIVLLFLAFTGLMVSLGLSPVPTSVLMKLSAGGDHTVPLGDSILWSLYSMTTVPGIILITLMIFLAYSAAVTQDRVVRWLAVFSGLALLGHVVSGKYGWLNRYEIYMVGFGLIISLHLAFRLFLLPGFGAPTGRRRRLGMLAILLVLTTWSGPYLMSLGQIPLASRNIYLQQWQIQRFLKDYHQGPVAVNDLGLVSYRYDPYVLDLWGLASSEAAYLRRTSSSADWMRHLVARHGVELVVIYDAWFEEVPEEWERLGVLLMETYRVSAAEDNVSFYATSIESAPRLRAQLERFSATLPQRARLELSQAHVDP